MQRITPFLWFDGNAEEAVAFYASIFKDGKVTSTMRTPPGGPGAVGAVLGLEFELEGQGFIALNGGPEHKFTPAISMFVTCKDQAEVDHYWDRLLEGGKPVACGWLTDKYGLSWQVCPRRLWELMTDKDQVRAGRVMQAMMKMVKLEISPLEAAYNQ